MRAARFYDQKDIRIEDIERPTAGPDDVLIDIAWCGICGTDIHEYQDGPIFIPPKGSPHPVTGEEAPITLGHEFSGTVAEVGNNVTDLKAGQNVVVEPYVIHKEYWGTDNYHLTPDQNFIGLAGGGGGLAEQIAVDQHWVHPIPDNLPLDEAALIEPLAVAYHAVERSEAKAGDVALIGGAGPIGLLTAAVAKAQGLTTIMSELSKKRIETAQETGVADHVANPKEVDVVEEVLKITDGKGADVGFEATSVDVVLNTIFSAVKKAGVIVNVSIWGHKPEANLADLVTKEQDLRGTIGYYNSHEPCIELASSGKVDLKPFITHKIALDELVDTGFDTLINHNDTAVKILVSPTGKGLDN
ncbi:MAG: 2,3-butanediol dehydrogenase [Micrococcus sp.]|nr:2,3-butanediol dehydrogenase [Micrococcus sp.]